jgi:hypothetical protein
MSTLALRNASSRHWLSPVTRFLAAFVAGVREGQEIANRYDTLSHLSDVELARHGLARTDVPQAAVVGVRGF